MHGPTGGNFCMVVSTRPNFIMPVQNFGGTPQKNSGAKNMQNLAWFRTTLKFGGEYLWNEWRYSKSDKYFIYRDFSRIRRNKSSEVWSSNLGDLDVKSYPLKAHFSEKHILAPRGWCTPKFWHPLGNDQVLLVHPSPQTGAFLTIFFKGGQKLA